MKSRWLSIFMVLALAVVGLTANVATSQTTGGIEGTVSDANDAPLPGASVDLKSPSLQGPRSAVTNSAGRFRFPVIPPGTYTVTCSLSGFKKVEKNGVKVNLDATATVLIRMEISVTQEIVVSGEAPVVDTNDAATGINIRQDVVQKLPLGRNYAQAVEINPGVAIDSGDTQGRAHGVLDLRRHVRREPVPRGRRQHDERHPRLPGQGHERPSSSRKSRSRPAATRPSTAAPWAGSSTSSRSRAATSSTATASATSTRRASRPPGRPTPRPTRTTSAAGRPASTQSQRDVQDFGVDLGGYAIKDRLWFFGAYNRVNQNVDQLTLAGTGLPNAGENFPISYHADLFSGKLTARPTDSTTIVGTIFGDPEQQTGALRNFTSDNPVSQDGTRKIGATDFAVGVTQLFGSSGLFDVRYSRHQDRYALDGRRERASRCVHDYTSEPRQPDRLGRVRLDPRLPRQQPVQAGRHQGERDGLPRDTRDQGGRRLREQPDRGHGRLQRRCRSFSMYACTPACLHGRARGRRRSTTGTASTR